MVLVGLAHATLLLDLGSVGQSETTSTQIAANALAPTSAEDAPKATASPQAALIRWAGAPAPPPPPPAAVLKPKPQPKPRPSALPEPQANPAPEPTPDPAPWTPPDLAEAVDPPSPIATLEVEPEAAQVDIPPMQTRLVYDITGLVKGRDIFAQGLFEWTVQNGRYDAVLEVRMVLLGSRTQTSVGRIGPQGLVPERFGERQRSETATHFDHEGQRLRFSRNRPDAPLLPGTQDRLSVILQLAALMQARPQDFERGHTVGMPVASSRGVDDWRWQVGDLETVELPKGNLVARHLKRPALHDRDNTLELWMAPELQHLPARIRITHHNGDWLDQRLVLRP